MNYKTYLTNKNLSNSTIRIYLKHYRKWNEYIGKNNSTKKLFSDYLKQYQKKCKPATVRLVYWSILSILKFKKKWKLINECKDIKLPKSEFTLKQVISLGDFEKISNQYSNNSWYKKRDWLIYSFMFLTGIRVSELSQINVNKIIDNKILINGKGNKTRIVYINDYLLRLIKEWKYNKICISKNKKILTTKQIYLIVNKISKTYFKKNISPHGLRRSYATNLLKSNINIEIVRKTLGHSNINTTSRYIQYTDEEILNEIKNVFK